MQDFIKMDFLKAFSRGEIKVKESKDGKLKMENKKISKYFLSRNYEIVTVL